jgi:hypothetical protein
MNSYPSIQTVGPTTAACGLRNKQSTKVQHIDAVSAACVLHRETAIASWHPLNCKRPPKKARGRGRDTSFRGQHPLRCRKARSKAFALQNIPWNNEVPSAATVRALKPQALSQTLESVSSQPTAWVLENRSIMVALILRTCATRFYTAHWSTFTNFQPSKKCFLWTIRARSGWGTEWDGRPLYPYAP